MAFSYDGDLTASKSILNRLLILKSYAPHLQILGESLCEDVIKLRSALARMSGSHICGPTEAADCGHAGAVLRFLAFRMSREPGRHELTGSERLFSRPQEELASILDQLGVTCRFEPQKLIIEGSGWQNPRGPLKLNVGKSSQFLSGLVLNAWRLPFALDLELSASKVSEGYWLMTKAVCEQAGMTIEQSKASHLRLPALQNINATKLKAECDLSSLFSIAAIAAVSGQAVFRDFPRQSLQPDVRFVEVLQRMGVPIKFDGPDLHVTKAQNLKPIEADLGDCPDLFPVLSVLCAAAEGNSSLTGAPQLRHKESDRIAQVAALLKLLNVTFEERDDGIEIFGKGSVGFSQIRAPYEPAQDHRMAMAAQVANELGADLKILSPQVVEKSFPEFWDIAEMKTRHQFLIGHRGVGKTTLLAKWAQTKGLVPCDLDQEICESTKLSISEIFSKYGEAKFREIEAATLSRVLARPKPQLVALGAGYNGPKPPGQTIWIQRQTDLGGRVFNDRPRLDMSVAPLKEFQARFAERELRFAAWADYTIALEEGESEIAELAQMIDSRGTQSFSEDPKLSLGADITIPDMPDEKISHYIQARLGWGVRRFELRDDTLSFFKIRLAFQNLSPEHALLSLRNKADLKARTEWAIKNGLWIDWDLALGPVPENLQDYGRLIISLHHNETVSQVDELARLIDQLEAQASSSAQLKLAVQIDSMVLLKAGEQWRARGERNSFLPMSGDGRWAWYRLRVKNRQNINFVREGRGLVSDQPSILMWLAKLKAATHFAAVLGAPVSHSRTPTEQREFFKARNMDTYAIHVAAEEFSVALEILRGLGMRAAAVTSPLKELAFKACLETSTEAREFGLVNTMVYGKDKWTGTNTDGVGFARALKAAKEHIRVPNPKIGMWGSGAMAEVVRSHCQDMSSYSARAKEVPQDNELDILVWGVGRSRTNSGAGFPPVGWKVKAVLDLNYAEDSPGREYAQVNGAHYLSGDVMFKSQAQAQREFWRGQDL